MLQLVWFCWKSISWLYINLASYQPHRLRCNQITCPIFWVMCCLAAVDEDSSSPHVGKLNQPCDSAWPLYRDIKASQKSFAGGANFNLLVELQPTTDKAAGMVGPAVTWSTFLVVWTIKIIRLTRSELRLEQLDLSSWSLAQLPCHMMLLINRGFLILSVAWSV